MSKLRLTGSTSGFTELTAPAVAGSNTLTLPTGNGTAGQFLQTNGSGALSFASAGKILQVVSTTKTDTFTTTTILNTSSGGAQITGLTATITPTSASSKILVIANVSGNGTTNVSQVLMRLYRDSTIIGTPANVSNRPGVTGRIYFNDPNATNVVSIMHLDSPATTSAITYSIYAGPDVAGTIYINRTQNDSDQANSARTPSVITVMEVAA